MEAEVANIAVQIKGCELLNEHIDLDPEKWDAKCKGKFMPALLRAMKFHPNDVHLQTGLITAVVKLSECSIPDRNMFIAEGGMDAIITAMNKHKENGSLQVISCCMIQLSGRDLLALPHKMTRSLARCVLTALNTHMGNSELASLGLEIISYLSSELTEALADESIRVIVGCMRKHEEDETIQSYGCASLSKIAVSESGAGRIQHILWSAGALGAITSAMQLLLSGKARDKNISGDLQNERVLMEHCCLAIWRMYDTYSPPVDASLKILSRLMIVHMQSVAVLQRAMDLMKHVCTRNVKNSEIFGRQGIRAVLLAMQTHQDDEATQTIALRAIVALVMLSLSNARCLFEEDSRRILMRQINMHMDSNSVRFGACSLFLAVAQSADKRLLLAMCDSLECVSKATLHKEAEDEESREAIKCGFLTFTYMTRSAADHLEDMLEMERIVVRTNLAKADAVEAIVHGLRTFPDDDQRQFEGFDALTKLLMACPVVIADNGTAIIKIATSQVLSHLDPKTLNLDRGMVAVTGMYLLDVVLTWSRKIGMGKEFQDAFGQHNGFEVACKYLGLYLEGQKMNVLREVSENIYQQVHCLLTPAISSLCMGCMNNEQNQAICAQNPMILRRVLQAMEKYPELRDIQLRTIEAIYHVAGKQEASHKMLAATGKSWIFAHAAKTYTYTPGSKDISEFFKKLARESKDAPPPEAVETPTGSQDGSAGARKSDQGVPEQRAAKSAGKGARIKVKAIEACMGCGKTVTDAGVRLFKCSACTIEPTYCSTACQHKCWSEHKAECKANKKSAK